MHVITHMHAVVFRPTWKKEKGYSDNYKEAGLLSDITDRGGIEAAAGEQRGGGLQDAEAAAQSPVLRSDRHRK